MGRSDVVLRLMDWAGHMINVGREDRVSSFFFFCNNAAFRRLLLSVCPSCLQGSIDVLYIFLLTQSASTVRKNLFAVLRRMACRSTRINTDGPYNDKMEEEEKCV